MPIVQAKCTNCGAVLVVDSVNKTASCKYCGSSFLLQDAIQYFNNTYVTNNNYNIGNAQNVYITGEDRRQRLIKNALAEEKLERYNDARKFYLSLTTEYPDEYMGWFGLAKIDSKDFTNVELPDISFEEVKKRVNHALTFAPVNEAENIRKKLAEYEKKRDVFLEQRKAQIKQLESKQVELKKEREKVDTRLREINSDLKEYGERIAALNRGSYLDELSQKKLKGVRVTLFIIGVICAVIFAISRNGLFLGITILLAVILVVYWGIQVYREVNRKTEQEEREKMVATLKGSHAEESEKLSKLNDGIDNLEKTIQDIKSGYSLN